MTQRIAVGVDESEGAAEALRWAVREAEARDAELTAVLAWGLLDQHHLARDVPFDPHYGEAEADAALAEILRHVLGDAADTVLRRTISDLPVRAVLTAAEDADLVVVGARGLGGFKGLLLGSVSHGVLRGAHGPVAVVRGDTADGQVRRIAVGVDGSATADAALAWAIGAARAHDAEVEVVHAWQTAALAPSASFDLANITAAEDAGRRLLDEVVEAVDTEGVTVERTLAFGSAGRAVLEAAERADLTVVGARGHGVLTGFVLGSVSQQVVHHAPGPVVVVPG